MLLHVVNSCCLLFIRLQKLVRTLLQALLGHMTPFNLFDSTQTLPFSFLSDNVIVIAYCYCGCVMGRTWSMSAWSMSAWSQPHSQGLLSSNKLFQSYSRALPERWPAGLFCGKEDNKGSGDPGENGVWT